MSPWYEFATILAIATLPVAILIILTKLMQRQRRLRVALPWFVRSVAAVSVVYLIIAGGGAVLVYLIFVVLLVSGMLGLMLGLIAATIASIIQRSLKAGLRISLRMLEGSILTAIIIFAITCHFIGPLLFEEIADPSETGDGILGLTYQGLVAMYAVLPASLLGSLMGGVLGYPPKGIEHK